MTTTSSNLAGPVAERIAALRAEREAEQAEAERKQQAQLEERIAAMLTLVRDLLGDLADHAQMIYPPAPSEMIDVDVYIAGLPAITVRVDFLFSRICYLTVEGSGEIFQNNTNAIVRDLAAERRMLDAALLAAADLAGEER